MTNNTFVPAEKKQEKKHCCVRRQLCTILHNQLHPVVENSATLEIKKYDFSVLNKVQKKYLLDKKCHTVHSLVRKIFFPECDKKDTCHLRPKRMNS